MSLSEALTRIEAAIGYVVMGPATPDERLTDILFEIQRLGQHCQHTAVDGSCTHALNPTPECHARACPEWKGE